MSAEIIRFPGAADKPDDRMFDVALEIARQHPKVLCRKVREILDEGAIGLLRETDNALSDAAFDFGQRITLIEFARERLKLAIVAADGQTQPAA